MSTQCPRYKQITADFLHLAWGCQQVQEYWLAVVNKIKVVVQIQYPADPRCCLLGDTKRGKGQKMSHRFLMLMLVLAKRRVAITWMAEKGPSIERWEADVIEWAVAEMERNVKQFCEH